MRNYDEIPLRNLIRARDMRKNQTSAERELWKKLRNEKLGVKFRRQHAIDMYIADFVCLERVLIVEVDGATHWSEEELARDSARTMRLEGLGFRVKRFTNQQIYHSLEFVMESVRLELDNR